MKKLRLIIGAVLSITLLMSLPAWSAGWYVVKHELGDTMIVEYKPGPKWSVVSGPYDTKEAAARAGGVDIPVGMAVSPTDRKNPTKKAAKGGDGKWYVVKHETAGDTVVIDYKPGPRWSVVSGPYNTKEQAAREGGVDIPKEAANQPEARRNPPEKTTAETPEMGWFVVKNRLGKMTIVEYRPGGNWSVVSGPYKTKEEAAREGGIDLPVKDKYNVPKAP
jgi:hypothetical protein